MTDCTISGGIQRGCRDNAGGVYEFYINNFDDVTGYEFEEPVDPSSPTDAELLIIGRIKTINRLAADKVWYKFVPNKNSSNVVENIQTSLENGTSGYEQVITMIFGKMETSKRNQVALMGAGNLLIITKDKNNRFWLYGKNDAMVLSGGNAGTGTTLTDLNGYSLTFTSLEGDLALEVDPTIIDELLNVTTTP